MSVSVFVGVGIVLMIEISVMIETILNNVKEFVCERGACCGCCGCCVVVKRHQHQNNLRKKKRD